MQICALQGMFKCHLLDKKSYAVCKRQTNLLTINSEFVKRDTFTIIELPERCIEFETLKV